MSPDSTEAAEIASEPLSQQLEKVHRARRSVEAELRKLIVGQDDAVDQVLIGMFAGGHCMIQGAPGTAKTVLIASLARVMDLEFKRIQFTPDLMPSDISGTEILEEDRSTGKRFVKFVRGPVFSNVVMADEINRTPPKTQAALLEVMQEKQVTIGGQTHELPKPHFVLATQIALEQEGTYPLPEAQQDRFMLSIHMDYLPEDQEVRVVRATTSAGHAELGHVATAADLLAFARTVRRVSLPRELGQYIVDLVAASRPETPDAPDFVNQYIAWGAGIRASQNMALAAKSAAAQDARESVGVEHVRRVILPVLRHRIGLSFRAEVDKVGVEDVIGRLVESVPAPRGR